MKLEWLLASATCLWAGCDAAGGLLGGDAGATGGGETLDMGSTGGIPTGGTPMGGTPTGGSTGGDPVGGSTGGSTGGDPTGGSTGGNAGGEPVGGGIKPDAGTGGEPVGGNGGEPVGGNGGEPVGGNGGEPVGGNMGCEPVAETCNDVDDDCDGTVDEDFDLGSNCTVGEGACTGLGVIVCSPDGTAICNGVAPPASPEVCDGLDNDCNGDVDDGIAGVGQACEAGEGACRTAGTTICAGDGSIVCDAVERDGGPEVCDGVDNDCNDVVDDVQGLGDFCLVGVGQCAGEGIVICGDGPQPVCNAVEMPASPEVCDGIDNDCNGAADDVPGGCGPADPCEGVVCDIGQFCRDGACVGIAGECADVVCGAGQTCVGGACVDGVSLGELSGFGHHGTCETWNGCNDAETCADAACRFYGHGDAIAYNENGCQDVAGLDCNLFNALPDNLDDQWPGFCNIPVAWNVRCAPAWDNGDVRLVGGDSPEHGRVEVFFNGQWGTVCDDAWELADADVVCRALGYAGASEAIQNFGGGADPIWLDDVNCMGTENNLALCPALPVGEHNCVHDEDAGVRCLAAGQCLVDAHCGAGLACVNGTCEEPPPVDPCQDVVCARGEICVDGLCLAGFELGAGIGFGAHGSCESWNACNDAATCANAACRFYGYGDAFLWTDGRCTDDNLFCRLFNSVPDSLDEQWGGGCNIPAAYDVHCRPLEQNGDVRIVGSAPHNGRVEVYYNGTWGTVCDDAWELADADVVCRQLGFPGARTAIQQYGGGADPIHLDDVSCNGNEERLNLCPALPVGEHNCVHEEDAGVICLLAGECLADANCADGDVCIDGLCAPPVGPCGGRFCADGESCVGDRCVAGVPLGALNGFGHHGGCGEWNACGDAATCANAACAVNGQGPAVAWQEGNCQEVAGVDCNLFNSLEPLSLDDQWGGFCVIPLAYNVVCQPAGPRCGNAVCAAGEHCVGEVCVAGNALGDAVAFGHHGSCDSWNNCNDGATCADAACRLNGFVDAIAWEEGNCLDVPGLDCNLFNALPDNLDANWGNGCNIPVAYNVVCGAPFANLGAANAFGHHGSCDGWNNCNDAQTCANAACRFNGFGDALDYTEGRCTDVPGLDCNLFASLPADLDSNWPNGCNIPVVYDVDCALPVR
jgi:hypothetical protein